MGYNWHELIVKASERDLSDYEALKDYFDCCQLLEPEDFDAAHAHNKKVREFAKRYAKEQNSLNMLDLYKKTLLFDAPHELDSFIQYMEWERDPSKKFYLPRRKRLKQVVDALQDLADKKIDLLGISLPPGTGKALANDTPILTRDGWKNHGDLVVGDEVIGLDGNFKKVIAVHPKCRLDVLVEFTNGERIQCHENHEWMIYNRSRDAKNPVTLETKEIERFRIETGTPNKRGHRYLIQVVERDPVVGEKKKLPVDPYFLGVWLGDGSNKNPRITSPVCDYAIVERIQKRGMPIRNEFTHKTTGVKSYDFDMRKELQSIGMCHSRKTTTKHIPQEYLTACVDDRLQLLAGLIDTDGTLSGEKFKYSTTCEKLMNDIVELVSTFGWRVSVQIEEPKVSSSGITGRKPVYTIGFSPDIKIPCALQRKRNNGTKKRRIAIKSITRVEPKEGNCITVEGDGMYLAGRKMVPTHNTTLALFFLMFISGRNPEKPILTGSHSNAFLHGVYDECLRMLDPRGEYLFNDVFPRVHIVKTNAQDMMIDIGDNPHKGKRFATLEFSSVGSGNAGKVRAENLLYCDDLVSDITQAMSKDRLDSLWQQYTTDLRQRKIGDCRELHIATRWSVHDVIGRLEQTYEGNDKARFLVIPAMDENDQSNFDYGNHAGFTTQFYIEQREIMDDASWRALYMNQPIEREGQLYNEEELRRYFELPDGEPDAIISVCDTKDKGSDYCVMPIAYQYGQDFYIEEIICDNSAPEVVEARLVSALIKHRVQMSRFESNSAGGKIAEKVQREVKEKGGITKINTKYTTANKETKIIVNSPYVKEHFLFKDDSVLKTSKEYRRALQMLCGYTMAGKNKHDDVPDAFAMLSEYAQSFEHVKAKIFVSPF